MDLGKCSFANELLLLFCVAEKNIKSDDSDGTITLLREALATCERTFGMNLRRLFIFLF